MHIVCIFIFQDKTKSIIDTRSTKNISLYGEEYCVKNGFDTVEYLSKIPNIEYLTLQECSLAVKRLYFNNYYITYVYFEIFEIFKYEITLLVKTESNYAVLKKARVSRITPKPEEGNVLEKVSNVHRNLKGLQIMSTVTHTCNMV